MATDGPTPAPCEKTVFTDGIAVILLSGSSNMIEKCVKSIAKKAQAVVDWHYSGGIANVHHLGDQENRIRVEITIDELSSKFPGQILKRYPVEARKAAGLYREGQPLPEGTVGVYAEPPERDQVYLIVPET